MDSVNSLREQRKGNTVVFIDFCLDYKADVSKVCYAFVEGRQDSPYYKTIVKHRLPPGCEVRWYDTDGKKQLKSTYDMIRARGEYPKNRIIYIMDRDLSPMVSDPLLIEDDYVYITDGYSIENDILTPEAFLYAMESLLGFGSLRREDREVISYSYEKQRECFENLMVPIMANIVIWKRDETHVCYGDLKINDIITITNGVVSYKKNRQSAIEYQCKKFKMNIPSPEDVKLVVSEILSKNLSRRILRGKYLSAFFVGFCNWGVSFLRGKEYHVGAQVPFGETTLMQILGPACSSSASLDAFFNKTILLYFNSVK